MADDGTAVDTALISNRLVPGEALVGFAVAEREEGGVGCPDRAGQSGHVLGWRFPQSESSDFLLCGLWIWGLCRSCGMRSWNFNLSSHPCRVLRFKD